MDTDPMEGSSCHYDVVVKAEIIKEEPEYEDNFTAMELLEITQCEDKNDMLELNSTDAILYPKTGLLVCLHCLADVEPEMLNSHMIEMHNYRRVIFKCQICNSGFVERKMLLIHRKGCKPPPKKHKRKTFFQLMKEVEKYENSESINDFDPVTCPVCMLELPKYYLRDHLIAEHSEPELSLECSICKRTFKSKLTLKEHIKLVHDAIEDSEECELCGQKFSSQKYLSNHKRNVHPTGNKIHKCDVCGKVFKSRLCLHQHTKYVHPPESASVVCPYCPKKTFKSKINLQQHLKVSHGQRKKLTKKS